MYDSKTPEPQDGPDGPGLWQSWGTGRIVALVVLLVAANFLVQILVYAGGGGLFVPVLAGAVFGVFLPVFWLVRRGGLDPVSDFGLDRPGLVGALGAALLALTSLSPASLLAEFSLRLHPADPQWMTLFREALPDGPVATAVAVLAVVVAAPLAEEIVFRGLLHRLLHNIWGGVAATVLSALVFAIVHAEPWFLLGLFAVGVTLAVVWEVTRSVTACWIAHAVHNGISLGLMLDSGDVVAEPGPITAADWGWAAVSVVAFAGLALWLRGRRAGRAISPRSGDPSRY